MKQMIANRQRRFRERCLKYARYVFNDHFVLFLLVFLGFLAMQYSQILKNPPADKGFLLVGMLLILFALTLVGDIATYLEKPDKHFLLVREEELAAIIKQQSLRSMVFWGLFQLVCLALMAPLLLALGLPLEQLGLAFVLMLLWRVDITLRKRKKLLTRTGLDWDQAILNEDKRQQTILRFFALFTNVKGISNSVKRRKYLDSFLGIFPKRPENTWKHLFLRSYFRNGDLFPLTLRLLGISLMALVFIPQVWIGVGLTLLMNYLLLFQLTALYSAFDYQQLTLLFPLKKSYKKKGLNAVVQLVTGTVLALEMLVALPLYRDWQSLLSLLVGTLILQFLYLPYKVRRLVDERA